MRGIVVNYWDASERHALEEQLRHQAFHDVLTGLANRALLTDRLGHALNAARRHERGLAVLFIDVDDFKAINDSLGHSAGDTLLHSAGQRIAACLRDGDTAARIGGDEFAVLLEDIHDVDAVAAIADRVLLSLRRPFEVADRQLHLHASIGVALRTDGHEEADDLLRDADVAMYVAKRRGKDRVEIFETDVHRPTVTRLALLADLPKALEAGQFALVYQPVFELATSRMIGLEALLRWNHPERGLVLPDDFVTLAEDSGQIVTIGAWVLNEACRQLRVLDRNTGGSTLDMGVNVSARQVDGLLVATVREALRRSGLSPRRLILEITESALLEDPDAASDILQQLRSAGVRVAIDDFGTGHSSLDYLRRLPVDMLKIDRTFVGTLRPDEPCPELLASIVRLGATLRIDVVAEGVETADQARILHDLGARYAQGFQFSRPLSVDDVTRLVRDAATTEVGLVASAP